MSDYQNLPLSEVDPEIEQVLKRELERQRQTLEMIASENFVPRSVLRPGLLDGTIDAVVS